MAVRLVVVSPFEVREWFLGSGIVVSRRMLR